MNIEAVLGRIISLMNRDESKEFREILLKIGVKNTDDFALTIYETSGGYYIINEIKGEYYLKFEDNIHVSITDIQRSFQEFKELLYSEKVKYGDEILVSHDGESFFHRKLLMVLPDNRVLVFRDSIDKEMIDNNSKESIRVDTFNLWKPKSKKIIKKTISEIEEGMGFEKGSLRIIDRYL